MHVNEKNPLGIKEKKPRLEKVEKKVSPTFAVEIDVFMCPPAPVPEPTFLRTRQGFARDKEFKGKFDKKFAKKRGKFIPKSKGGKGRSKKKK